MAYRNDTPLPEVLVPPGAYTTCLANANCCLTIPQLWIIITYLLSTQIADDLGTTNAKEMIAAMNLSGSPYDDHYLVQALACIFSASLSETRTMDQLWQAAQQAGFNSISEYERQLIAISGLAVLLNI